MILMLRVNLPSEYYDEDIGEFKYIINNTLSLEHSLRSIALWESKWKKPFLVKDPKTSDEILDYIHCMTNREVDEELMRLIPPRELRRINEYIEDPMTATTFANTGKKTGPAKIVTSEEIYHMMIAYDIPWECQDWHLNRLLTLLNICNIKNKPPDKISPSEIRQRNRDLNAARKRKLNTKG